MLDSFNSSLIFTNFSATNLDDKEQSDAFLALIIVSTGFSLLLNKYAQEYAIKYYRESSIVHQDMLINYVLRTLAANKATKLCIIIDKLLGIFDSLKATNSPFQINICMGSMLVNVFCLAYLADQFFYSNRLYRLEIRKMAKCTGAMISIVGSTVGSTLLIPELNENAKKYFLNNVSNILQAGFAILIAFAQIYLMRWRFFFPEAGEQAFGSKYKISDTMDRDTYIGSIAKLIVCHKFLFGMAGFLIYAVINARYDNNNHLAAFVGTFLALFSAIFLGSLCILIGKVIFNPRCCRGLPELTTDTFKKIVITSLAAGAEAFAYTMALLGFPLFEYHSPLINYNFLELMTSGLFLTVALIFGILKKEPVTALTSELLAEQRSNLAEIIVLPTDNDAQLRDAAEQAPEDQASISPLIAPEEPQEAPPEEEAETHSAAPEKAGQQQAAPIDGPHSSVSEKADQTGIEGSSSQDPVSLLIWRSNLQSPNVEEFSSSLPGPS